MKKALVLLLALCMVFSLVACAAPAATTEPEAPAAEAAPAAEPEESVEQAAGEPTEAPMYIPVLSKGFQHAFWQAVKTGADAAAADNGVEIYFVGPESESDIDVQVEQFKAEMEKNPSAIALAALSTDAVMEQLQQCVDSSIPVIGFDSGVPNAPEGSIYATASTNNQTAGGLAAEEFMKIAAFTDGLAAGTKDAPALICVLSQDATSESVTGRTTGFVNKCKELVEAAGYQVAVTGHDLWKVDNAEATVEIRVVISATTAAEDVANAAKAFLADGPMAVFCSNEGTVTGFLAATGDGADLAEGGQYYGLLVAGFDAGSTQKNAVRNGWFVGSVTQDPYNIGYQAVDLAVKAANGETVADIDTGAKWYTAENIDDPDIALLVYD